MKLTFISRLIYACFMGNLYFHVGFFSYKQINIGVNWSFKMIKKIYKKELVKRVGEAIVLWRRVHLYTTPKQLLMLCHWILHNILFHPRQRVLSFDGWIIIGAAFFYPLPLHSCLTFKISGLSSWLGIFSYQSSFFWFVNFYPWYFCKFLFSFYFFSIASFNLDFLFFIYFLNLVPILFFFFFFLVSFINFQLFSILSFNQKF